MLPELKPYLTALAMPLTSLLMLTFIAATLIHKRPKLAQWIIILSVTVMWILSTERFAVWLNNKVTPEYKAVTLKELKDNSIQAVVVLGGGVTVNVSNNEQQMSRTSLERLRLGAQLARDSGLPILFSGGSGWGSATKNVAEADVAEKVLLSSFGVVLKYKESNSKDTKENALNTWKLMNPNELTKIALVTHSSHMKRASFEFKNTGFTVLEAPVGQITPTVENGLSWLPSSSSLEITQTLVRELLARFINDFREAY